MTNRSLQDTRRRSAGIMSPGRELDHVAGHQVAQRQLAGLPVADHRRRDADHGLELVGGVAGPQFLDEAQAHSQDDHGQHDGRPPEIVGPSRNRDGQQHQSRITRGLAQAWPKSLIRRNRCSFATTLGPCCSRRRAASSSLRPLSLRFQPAKHLLGIAPGDLRQQGRNLDRLRRPPQSGQDVFRQGEDRQDRHGIRLAGIGNGSLAFVPPNDGKQAIIKGKNLACQAVDSGIIAAVRYNGGDAFPSVRHCQLEIERRPACPPQASDKPAPPPAPKKPSDDTPESVLLVPYPKIVFLYPTFLLAIVAAIWTHFLGHPFDPDNHTAAASARCSWGCSP